MVLEDNRALRLGRMRGQHQLDLHALQGRGDLIGRQAAVSQLLEALSPQRLQRRWPVRGLGRTLLLDRRVLLHQAQQVKRDRVRARQPLGRHRILAAGRVPVAPRKLARQAVLLCLVQDFEEAAHHEGEVAFDLLRIENENRRQDHVGAVSADATSMPRGSGGRIVPGFAILTFLWCCTTLPLQERCTTWPDQTRDTALRLGEMKRIGILTAGGDTPALNATIHGAVVRANQLRIEIYGLIKGFNCLFNPRVPHRSSEPAVPGNPGARSDQGRHAHRLVARLRRPGRRRTSSISISSRLSKLGIEGLIAIGGDGTLNGLQPLAERLPTVLAPKTIDNDLGLELPERARRVGPREGSRRRPRLSLHAHAVQRRLRSQPHRQLRDAGIRHRGAGHRAGRRAHPHDGGKPSPHRDHRGHGPAFRLHRARHGVRAAGHHPRARASARHEAARRARQAPLRPPEERRHRLRRGHRGRAGQRTGRGVDVDRSGRQRRS